MANELPGRENVNDEFLQAQMDLLEALLDPDDAPYPWNTAAPESEAYFAEREQYFVLDDWSEQEMASPTQTFLTQIDQLWSDIRLPSPCKHTTSASASAIRAHLQQQFAARIPQCWLDAIAHHAHQVCSTQRSMADQLVHCVQNLLPNWAEEDLLVLARPFAYTMRGTEIEAIEFLLGKVPNRRWTALSEIERARAGLAIARYALTQLDNS